MSDAATVEPETSEQEAPKENALPELELKRLLEIQDFSLAVQEINNKITEYHTRIMSLKSGLTALLEALPILTAELDQLDSLEKQLYEIIARKMTQKT